MITCPFFFLVLSMVFSSIRLMFTVSVGRAAQWIILAVELSRIVGMDWVSLCVLSDGIINNDAIGLLLDSGSKALWGGVIGGVR